MKGKIVFLMLLLTAMLTGHAAFADGDTPSVTISADSSDIQGICADIRLNIEATGIENPVYEIYKNDTLCDTVSGNFCVLSLDSGTNSIYAAEVSSGCVSNAIIAECKPYDVKATLFDRDYSSGTAADGMYAFKENSGSAQLGTIDEAHGQSLIIKWNGSGTAPNLAFANASKYSGIFVWSADYYIGNVNEQNIFTVKTDENAWLIGAGISTDGVLRYRDAKNAWKNTDITAAQGQWLHLKVIVDLESHTYTLYADGKAAAVNIPVTAAGSKIQYMSLGIKAPANGDESFIAIDNVKQYIIRGCYHCNIEYGNTDGNIYDETAAAYKSPRICAAFSEDMDETSVSEIRLLCGSDEVECDIKYYADSRTAVITPKADLIPDCDYSISFDNVLSAAETTSAKRRVYFRTDKLPLCIKSCIIADGKSLDAMQAGESFTANITVRNSENDETAAYVFVGIYSGNKLISIKSEKIALEKSLYTFGMTAPENADKCRIEAYLLRSNFELVDKIKF